MRALPAAFLIISSVTLASLGVSAAPAQSISPASFEALVLKPFRRPVPGLMQLLLNSRKTERGASMFLVALAVRAAPFALLIGIICMAGMASGAGIRVLAPPDAKVAGPYSPGVMANDFLYVSGQGPVGSDGKVSPDFDAQMRQTLENVKKVVVAGGLTMDHLVYAHVYLTDMANYDRMNRLWAEAFPHSPPARAVVGVYKLPGEGLQVEITAVAFKDLARRSVLVTPGYPEGPASAAVIAGEKIFLSGFLGVDAAGKVPEDPGAQVEAAFDQMKKTLAVAGLDYRHVVFVNPYQTEKVMGVMNKVYASHFEFDNTPARATIRVNSLPLGANIEFTGVAVRDLSKRRAVRPKNMAPSPTASPCVWGDDTLYCSAKSGFIPGPIHDIFAPTVEGQLRMTMRNLLDGLEEAGLTFANVVSTNVYLDDLKEFSAMNGVYAQYFPDIRPTRTTVAPTPPLANRGPVKDDVYPMLEQVSVIAVR
jgi:reactive intermediate/imine deaminase